MFVLTAIEFFIVIIAIYVVVYWFTPRKFAWFPFLLIVVLLSVLAFKFTPNDTDDLSRYFQTLNYLRKGGIDALNKCYEYNWNSWNTYRICSYYFYAISRLNNNHWLPAITIFIVYGLAFLIFYKAANHFKINKFYLFLGTMFFLSTYWFYDTASGIRNGLTFAVIFTCAYYHLVERKNIILCYIGYVLACFTHSAGILLVALVILAEITLNTSGKFMNFLLVFGLAAGGAFIQYLSTITDNSFIQSIAGKAEDNSSSGILNTQTNFVVNIITAIFVAFVIFYVSKYILHSEYTNDLKRIYKLSSIILYFMVGCLYSSLVFLRFARWMIPIIGAFFYMVGMQIQKNQIDEKGDSYYRYYSPPNESIRYKIKFIFNIMYAGYTTVHLWYLCAGSSLNWIHF